jgi:hypothetical protein
LDESVVDIVDDFVELVWFVELGDVGISVKLVAEEKLWGVLEILGCKAEEVSVAVALVGAVVEN